MDRIALKRFALPFIALSLGIALMACSEGAAKTNKKAPEDPSPPKAVIDSTGKDIASRFPTPAGFERQKLDNSSFAYYLRHFSLLPEGSPVLLYNGQEKGRQDVHSAVLDIDVGNRDLQQCADAIMRLRAEYLYKEKRYNDIHFNFTNGFKAEYGRWRNGDRISVSGNNVRWRTGGTASQDYESFRDYLLQVFNYAGSASLENELDLVNVQDIEGGDVFIKGGFPGHAVLVVDVALNDQGEKVFLLAQSYMPAQQIHILKNPTNEELSPWYAVSELGSVLFTPEWRFQRNTLRRFPGE